MRRHLDDGASVEMVARDLITLGVPSILIKALRSVTGMGLGELKALVDAALPDDPREATGRLRDIAEAALADVGLHDERLDHP